MDPRVDVDIGIDIPKLAVPTADLPEIDGLDLSGVDMGVEMPGFRMPTPGEMPDVDIPIGLPDVDVSKPDLPKPMLWRGLTALASGFGHLMGLDGWWDTPDVGMPEGGVPGVPLPTKSSAAFRINEDEE